MRGLQQPVAFDFDPRGRVWFVQKAVGDVQVFDPSTGRTHRFFRVTDLVTDIEEGLDGIALDPGFPDRPYVYLFATRLVDGHPTDQILAGDRGIGNEPQRCASSTRARRVRCINTAVGDCSSGPTACCT